MLKITSLDITDFGRHRSIRSKVSGHVVGLAGPNGRGKSTVLQAIQFALTGTIDHEDPLRAFIRRSSGDKPPAAAEVTLEFMADGKRGKIQRRITRTTVTRKLWWDNAEKPITAEAQVSDIMYNILGVDKKAINSTVFIRQGEMASMFGGEVDRRDFYTRLLMLGHLPKIANVLETHRESIAGSVQDLGAVRDAAEAAYEEARRFFEQCGAEMPEPVAAQLTLARDVMVSISRRAAAEDAVSKAEAKLRLVVPSNMDTKLWLANELGQRDLCRRTTDELAARQQAHLKARAAFVDVESQLRTALDLKQKHDDLAKAKSDLAAVGELTENPDPIIKSAEATLQKFDRLEERKETLPATIQWEKEAREKLEAAEEVVTALQAAYDANRETYAVTKSALNMRRDILKGAEGGTSTFDHCPLCNGEAPPDIEHLKKEIKEHEDLLQKITEKGETSGHALNEKKQVRDSLKHNHSTVAVRLESEQLEAKRLQVELSLTTRDATQKKLDDAKAAAPAWHAKAYERTRLTKEVDRCQALIGCKPEPTQVEITELNGKVCSNRLIADANSWNEEDDRSLNDVAAEARRTAKSVEDAQSEIAGVEAAENNLATANDRLTGSCINIPEGFFGPISGAKVMTPQMVQEKLTYLEQAQQAYDTAKGRLEGASEAMKTASRRIDELDLRTAEQKHRLSLAADLSELRDAFRPTGASLDYLNHKFGQIARLAGDYLAESGADFMVSASDEVPLAYDFLRTDRVDEAWMPQSRMSGGQKVRLAVATLRAMHAMIMPNVGLLVLDEPTTHLDEEAKQSMADMLRKIGDEGTLQIIVCDHSPTLIDAFSDRIEIPE